MKIFMCLAFVFLMFTTAFRGSAYETNIAEDITDDVQIISDSINVLNISDNNIYTHSAVDNTIIQIRSDIPIGGIYVKYNKPPELSGTVNDSVIIADKGFLHEYIPLSGETEAELWYQQADICDIAVYSQGQLPDDVQIWEEGPQETDLLLCVAHSDDDQLFFAGVIPYYAKHMGARVRVAYFVNHFDTNIRTHELLDGLWHCGLKTYPDIGPYPDLYSDSLESALNYYESSGFSYDSMVEYQRSLIEKYRPLVAVLHDFDGEYGHGTHMLSVKSFIDACESEEINYVPQKIYVHLYDENPIKLDIDSPLAEFNGKTAFQVSQEAFLFHKSQHWTWFYSWIYGKNQNITMSSQIRSYNPALYGLYSSLVGEDVNKNDFLENVITYNRRNQLQYEEKIKRLYEQNRAEQEWLKQQEIIKQQQKENDEQEALKEKQESEKLIAARKEQRRRIITVSILVMLAAVTVTVWAAVKKKKNKNTAR